MASSRSAIEDAADLCSRVDLVKFTEPSFAQIQRETEALTVLPNNTPATPDTNLITELAYSISAARLYLDIKRARATTEMKDYQRAVNVLWQFAPPIDADDPISQHVKVFRAECTALVNAILESLRIEDIARTASDRVLNLSFWDTMNGRVKTDVMNAVKMACEEQIRVLESVREYGMINVRLACAIAKYTEFITFCDKQIEDAAAAEHQDDCTSGDA